MIVLIVIGSIVGLIVLYLLFVALYPGLSVPLQPLGGENSNRGEVDSSPPPGRRDVHFSVKGVTIRAWLYLPEDVSTPVPCIIMGNGFGGTKDILLERYAVRYREAGYASLTFDYRHFGESGGEPRQLMSIRSQLEDYRAAISYARGLDEIDPGRIVLWGTSASGGYGIVIASEDRDVACAVAQCPGLDHKASADSFRKRAGIGHILRLVMHGQRDLMRSRLGLSPHRIPIVGRPGTVAFLTGEDAVEGYSAVGSSRFINEVCARVILRAHGFKPVQRLRQVRCPVLIQICELDSLAPIRPNTLEELRERANVRTYPIGHFEIYQGGYFEKAVSDQLEFFGRYL
jgi:hypothetical protein